MTRITYGAAHVDVVVCDLTRDPRSEDYVHPTAETAATRSGFFPARCALRPPSPSDARRRRGSAR
jgi:hypothetical protein